MDSLNKGYQLIEPNFLSDLIRKEISQDIVEAIMKWLIELLKQDEQIKGLPIEIDILTAEYHGKYLCFGVYYQDTSLIDVGDIVLHRIEYYFNQSNFLSFYESLFTR